MKGNLYFFLCILSSLSVSAQEVLPVSFSKKGIPLKSHQTLALPAKLFQRNHGVIIGLQRGAATAIEFGGEAHWRKISLRDPHILGTTVNMEYNFANHVVGYKAGVWMKKGRINFTYGANLAYFTDFKGKSKYGGGPAVGFRLMGFHLINGYNFLGGDKELEKVNSLYMTLRYYFPLQNKFTWDRSDKEKRKKARAKAQRKKEQEMKREKKEKKPLLRIKGLTL